MGDTKKSAFEFFETVMKSPKHVMAPMVENSDLCFRLLARKYNTHLTYTPMLYSGLFVRSETYRTKEMKFHEDDRPLVVQFCGDNVEDMLQASLLVQDYCDAIDINLGCPQLCAKQGGYGAFMSDNPGLVYEIVQALHNKLKVPIFCKMRILPTLEKTLEYAKGLEKAGCQLLVVHGRTREQIGASVGKANWDYIKAVKQNLSIPIVANGNIEKFEDVQKCIEYTGCDAVMSAYAMMDNPAFFSNISPHPTDLLIEYLELCKKYPTKRRYISSHVHFMLRREFLVIPSLRSRYYSWKDLDYIISLMQEIKQLLPSHLEIRKIDNKLLKRNKKGEEEKTKIDTQEIDCSESILNFLQ